MKIIIQFLCIILIALTTSCKQDSATIDLKFNLEKGQKYQYTYNTKQLIIQELNGEKMEMNQEMITYYLFEVLDIVDGIRSIKTTYNRIKIKNINEIMPIDFDSDQSFSGDTTDLLDMILRPIIDYSFLIDVNQLGDVVKVEGIQEVIELMLSNVGVEGEMMVNNFKTQFSEDGVARTLENGFKFFPDGPVKKGDKWNSELVLGAPANMITKNEYKLSSVKENIAELSVNSTIKTLSEKEKPSTNGTEITILGTQEGTIEVNIPTGLVVKYTSTQILNQTIKAQGLEMPMTITSDIVVKGKQL